MASKVELTGRGLCSGKTNVYNDIIANKSNYRSGRLSTEIDGPSRASIRYIDQHDGTVKISWKPSIPGDYVIKIKLDTFYCEGSPYRVKVTGAAPVSLTKYGDGHVRTIGRPGHYTNFTTSADFVWIKKDGVKLSNNGSDGEIFLDNGRKSCIDVIRYTL